MSTSIIEADVIRLIGATIIDGPLHMQAGAIANSHIAANAAIAAGKLDHRFRPLYAQPNTTATAETRVIFVAGATGALQSFFAGSIAPCTGNADITVDLKKNGTTVLSAEITLDSGNSARIIETASIASAAYVAGDVFEIVIAVDAGTGALGTGLFAGAEFEEAA